MVSFRPFPSREKIFFESDMMEDILYKGVHKADKEDQNKNCEIISQSFLWYKFRQFGGGGAASAKVQFCNRPCVSHRMPGRTAISRAARN